VRKALILWAWLLLCAPCFAENTAASKPTAGGVISQAVVAVKDLAGDPAPLSSFELAQRILLVPGVSLDEGVELKPILSQTHIDQAASLLDEHLADHPNDPAAVLLLAYAKWESISQALPTLDAHDAITRIEADCLPLLDILLAQDQSRTEAFNLAATIHFECGMLHESVASFTAAHDSFSLVAMLQPQNATALEALTRVLMLAGELDSAIEKYQKALKLSPVPKYYLPLISILESDPKQADLLSQIWEAFLTDCPTHPEALLANGSRLIDAGSYNAALETLARGSEQLPNDTRFLRRMGECYWSLGDYPAAVTTYEIVLEHEYDPVVVANLAGALTEVGDDQAAQALWRKHVRFRPDDAMLAMQYGLAMFEVENFRGALEQYERGEKLEPGNHLFFNRAGLCLFHLGDFTSASKHVKEALDLKSDPLYYNNLAIAYENTGESELAGKYYSLGLTEFPDDAGLLENYTAFLLSTGEGSVALEQLQLAAIASSNPDLHIRLADVATTQGEYGIADNAYSEAIRLRPDEPWPILTYALFLAGLNRFDHLEAHMKFASSRLSDDDFAWIVDELGLYWSESEKYGRGADFMGNLAAQMPTTPKVYTTWALLLSLDGKNAEALETTRIGLRQAGETYSARYLEAMLSGLLESPDEALDMALKLVSMPQVDVNGYLLLLDLQDENGAVEELVESARQAIAAFPANRQLFERLAYALYFSGQNREVVELLEDDAFVRHRFTDRNKLLGLGYLETGNYVKSARFLFAASDDDPGNPELWARLGEARFFQRDYERAKEALDTALKIDPALVEGRLWLGMALIELKHFDEADTQFKAVETSPYSPPMALAWIALGRGRLALAKGDKATARLLLDEAKAYGAGVARFDLELESSRREAGRF